jgi:S-adenosylmethionine:tRNA ribosyltransferase-isomerase
VRWRALAKPGRALTPGRALRFGALAAHVEQRLDDGQIIVAFDVDENEFPQLLEREGRMPLPPYIRRDAQTSASTLAEDRERYQTVYAREPGAVAAPTAGLHFTDDLFAAIRARGAFIAEVTLRVGAGTFLPIRTDDLSRHVMHAESFELPPETAAAIDACRARGGRVIAVGTTTARVLETLAGDDGRAPAGRGETSLFIAPGRPWRAVDALITNFHLPRSTLLVLVCALAGTDRLLAAYREAVALGYRFFSYGDACWIERDEGEF